MYNLACLTSSTRYLRYPSSSVPWWISRTGSCFGHLNTILGWSRRGAVSFRLEGARHTADLRLRHSARHVSCLLGILGVLDLLKSSPQVSIPFHMAQMNDKTIHIHQGSVLRVTRVLTSKIMAFGIETQMITYAMRRVAASRSRRTLRATRAALTNSAAFLAYASVVSLVIADIRVWVSNSIEILSNWNGVKLLETLVSREFRKAGGSASTHVAS